MRIRALAIAATLALLTLPALAGHASADQGGRPLKATLTGPAEVPGPGDPDGTGTASIRANPGLGKVCFTLHVSGIFLPATAAHIHAAATGVAGAVVVTLTPPNASGDSSGCVTGLARSLVKAMVMHPSAYYVNVHTTDYPGGALRGQLAHRGSGAEGGGGGEGEGGAANHLTATLKGANEFPGPGDPDGTGSATIDLMPDQGVLCYELVVSGISLPATAAHVHAGGAGVAGPVVVTLNAPDATGFASACISGLAHDLLTAIRDHPSSYYVNVHTTDYPGGALRGQLSGSGDDDDQGDDDQGDDD